MDKANESPKTEAAIQHERETRKEIKKAKKEITSRINQQKNTILNQIEQEHQNRIEKIQKQAGEMDSVLKNGNADDLRALFNSILNSRNS